MCPDLAHIRPEDTFPVSSAAKYLKSGVMEHGKFELRPNLSLHSLQNTAWLQYTKSYIFRYPSRFGLDSSIHLPKQCLSEGNKNINLRKYKSLNLTVCRLDQLHLHWPSMCHGYGLEGCRVCWELGKREGGPNFGFSFQSPISFSVFQLEKLIDWKKIFATYIHLELVPELSPNISHNWPSSQKFHYLSS